MTWESASKVLLALIPLTIGAFATIAWQNSHTLTVITTHLENMRVDLERTKVSLEPGRTFSLRIDKNEDELKHLRELVEQRLTCK
jgi:hypothetical protein